MKASRRVFYNLQKVKFALQGIFEADVSISYSLLFIRLKLFISYKTPMMYVPCKIQCLLCSTRKSILLYNL
jgi:hypothetical protein